MSSQCRNFMTIMLIALAFSAYVCSVSYAAALTDSAESKLQAANTSVEQAFEAVLSAEQARANTTVLIAELNNATTVLAQAENLYRAGDSNSALAQANTVISITQRVKSLAYNAQQSALISGKNSFLMSILFSATAAFVFVLVLFFAWRWFKQRYVTDILRAKPEMNGQ